MKENDIRRQLLNNVADVKEGAPIGNRNAAKDGSGGSEGKVTGDKINDSHVGRSVKIGQAYGGGTGTIMMVHSQNVTVNVKGQNKIFSKADLTVKGMSSYDKKMISQLDKAKGIKDFKKAAANDKD